ncbi:MAG: NmrA family NAD(P)-binding protein, partial [Polyangiales bacterium]
MPDPMIILAGATGNLGGRMAKALRERGASVRAIVRRGTPSAKVGALRDLGVAVAEVDFASPPEMTAACAGGTCVVSALSGLRPVIVDAQSALLDAAVAAGVPRFIPSDYSIDFTRLPSGTNRNFDLRRDFHAVLDRARIAATSIFNGAFAELLTGPAPIVLFKLKRVVYWRSADQRMDFTAMDDVATYTAHAALDATTPRYLNIAGDRVGARDLAFAASEVTGKTFRLLRAGDLPRLETLIAITRALVPARREVFPPWQGMQYLRDMFGGL